MSGTSDTSAERPGKNIRPRRLCTTVNGKNPYHRRTAAQPESGQHHRNIIQSLTPVHILRLLVFSFNLLPT